jgi:hypothetical protein
MLVAHAARVLRKFRSTHETALVNRSIADRAAFPVTTTLVVPLAMLRRKRVRAVLAKPDREHENGHPGEDQFFHRV